MTDTTDIKALREQWETLHERLDLDIFITTVLTALEAERQRADKSDAMLSECLESLKAAEKELGIRSNQLVKADASVADLEKRLRCTEEAMIAATDLHGEDLKGEQVPVALVDERQGSGGFCLTKHGRRLNIPHGTELFTATQKPVVLPDKIPDALYQLLFDECGGFVECDLNTNKVWQAFKALADGGIVSTSDELLMQGMSGIVKDGE